MAPAAQQQQISSTAAATPRMIQSLRFDGSMSKLLCHFWFDARAIIAEERLGTK
jgi:hypothetical protein